MDTKGPAYSGARAATKQEIEEDKKVQLYINEFPEGKYIIFTTSKPFPRSSKVTAKIGPIVSEFLFFCKN